MRFVLVNSSPFPAIMALDIKGSVGWISRSWNDGNVLWVKLPWVRGICDKPDYGCKLAPKEVTGIGLGAFLTGCLRQLWRYCRNK